MSSRYLPSGIARSANTPLDFAVSYRGAAEESFKSNNARVAPFIDCLLDVSDTVPLTTPVIACCAADCKHVLVIKKRNSKVRRNHFAMNSCISLKMVRSHRLSKPAFDLIYFTIVLVNREWQVFLSCHGKCKGSTGPA